MRRIGSICAILGAVVCIAVASAFAADAPDLSGYKTVAEAQRLDALSKTGISGQAGYLGVEVEARQPGKLLVTAVDPDSPAERAGLQIDDAIVQADGNPVSSVPEFRQQIQGRSTGDLVALTIERKDQTITLRPVLTALSRPLKLGGDQVLLGIRVADARDETGSRVEQVLINTPAARAGLRVGDMLLKVGDTTISASVRVTDAMADKKPGQTITLSITRDGQPMQLKALLTADVGGFGGRRGGGFRFGPAAATPAYWRRPLIKIAIVGIEFPDTKHSDTIETKNWEEAFFSKKTYTGKNATGQPAYGSVAEYFAEQSYGAQRIDGKMIGWVTVSKKRQEYILGSDNSGRHPLIVEATGQVFQQIGINSLEGYDAIAFMYAGARIQTNRGAVYYPHAAATLYRGLRMPYIIIPENPARMTNISLICHEIGRMIGLPDLASRPDQPGTEGLGVWCGMSNIINTGRPQHFGAWCKEQMGWVTPTMIDPAVKQKLILSPIEDSPRECIKIPVRRDGSEYFLLENRQRKGFDAGLPADGLLIWRVVNDHPTLEGAHGFGGPAAARVFLSMVPFPSSANNSFTPQTTPSSQSQLGGGSAVYITDIRRLADGRITFAIGYDVD
ncbi:MAG TPA: M6 family metalloprotease domain-containing protein [Humisphaera sp.]|jgi:M6 family metalloprotease-like protein|nr:M6 family metalloprotease domain-containing protein [Humisphaera sp.]